MKVGLSEYGNDLHMYAQPVEALSAFRRYRSSRCFQKLPFFLCENIIHFTVKNMAATVFSNSFYRGSAAHIKLFIIFSAFWGGGKPDVCKAPFFG